MKMIHLSLRWGKNCTNDCFMLHTYFQWRTQEFCSGEGGSTNSVQDRGQRERGSGGGSPLLRGSGGSCNLVQEIPFHTMYRKIFLILGTLRLFMVTTNLFVIANVKQLRTDGSFKNFTVFFKNILGCWLTKFSNV